LTGVRWTTAAADDLVSIVEYIQTNNPEAALRVAKSIYDGIASLRSSPRRGRKGVVDNTRELIFAPWPYIAVYEIVDDQVQVFRIRHAAQNWP
jgi:addiction module RelE/StbE family toxin